MWHMAVITDTNLNNILDCFGKFNSNMLINTTNYTKIAIYTLQCISIHVYNKYKFKKLFTYLFFIKKIIFYRFPLNNKELTKKWTISLKRKNCILSQSRWLYFNHFNENDFQIRPGAFKLLL